MRDDAALIAQIIAEDKAFLIGVAKVERAGRTDGRQRCHGGAYKRKGIVQPHQRRLSGKAAGKRAVRRRAVAEGGFCA